MSYTGPVRQLSSHQKIIFPVFTVGEKVMVPFKVIKRKKVIVPYKYNRHARIKDVLDIPKQSYTDLHDTKCLVNTYL